jgi:hypothetical protein
MTGAARTLRSIYSTFASIACVSAVLAGCGGGDGGDSSTAATTPSSNITPAPGGSSPSPVPTPGTPQPTPTPVPSPTPTPSPAPTPSPSNTAPKISGATLTSATVNSTYTFTPSASDPDGDTIAFQIQNKPAWATFNTVNGKLSGTPKAAGTFANIVISAHDGKASASLPAFSIKVSEMSDGKAVELSWTAPTENSDGTALVGLAGFTIVYGPSSTMLHQSLRIENPGLDRYVLNELPAGTYYFGVKAFTANGVESTVSNVVSKVVL